AVCKELTRRHLCWRCRSTTPCSRCEVRCSPVGFRPESPIFRRAGSMKQWGLCAGAIVAGGMLAIGGAATAAAVPAVVGQPYADAAQAIEDAGGTPRVASRVGTQLSDDECIVTNAWEASFVR